MCRKLGFCGLSHKNCFLNSEALFVFFCMCTVIQYRQNTTILYSEFCFYQVLPYIWLSLHSLFQPTKPHVPWKMNKSITNVTWNLFSNLNLCSWEKCINLFNHLWHQYHSISLLCYIIEGSSLWSLYVNSVILLAIIMWFFSLFFLKRLLEEGNCVYIYLLPLQLAAYIITPTVLEMFSG